MTAAEWQEVDEHLTTDGAPTEFELDALVPAKDHVEDGRITLLVQHSEGFTTPGQSTRGDQVPPYSGKGVTPRDRYDFTVAWESDTQYYNQNPDFYPHQRAIHDFLVAQRSNLDLQFLMHTGDIVNDWDQPAQWQRADAAYRDLDEARIPYSVLAGNHDVGHHRNDYGAYGRWFGEQRFAGNPWFGGSLQDNRGSYSLVSADGIDLMVVSMGWGAGDQQIRWMNRVIGEHPERKVIINLHEFMLTTVGSDRSRSGSWTRWSRPTPTSSRSGRGTTTTPTPAPTRWTTTATASPTARSTRCCSTTRACPRAAWATCGCCTSTTRAAGSSCGPTRPRSTTSTPTTRPWNRSTRSSRSPTPPRACRPGPSRCRRTS